MAEDARDSSGYATIESSSKASVTIERSEFIGQAFPVGDTVEASRILAQVRAENPKARHTAWAYVLADQSSRSSDDGEPSGTAGKPILDVICHEGLRDVAVYVTRYFGGVLLGTGGLVRAYTKAAQLCLQHASRVRCILCIPVSLTVPYALFDRVTSLAQRMGGRVESPVYAENVSLTVLFSEEQSGCDSADAGSGGARGFVASVRELSAGLVDPQMQRPVVRALRDESLCC